MHVTPPDAHMPDDDDGDADDPNERVGGRANDSAVDHPADFYDGKGGE